MNPEQLKSGVRWVIATFGPFLIAHGYASSGTLELVGGILISLAPLIWSMFVHTEANAVAVVVPIATGPASDTSVAAQTALIEGTKAVALDTSIPKSVEAKNTLVAATIALPQVKTIVTDAQTADASPSPSVIAASDLRKVGT
jgi:hypothetical protein